MNLPSSDLPLLCQQLGFPLEKLGIVIVDHGSRREESNNALLRVVELFKSQTSFALVRPAHMELAEPTIKDAFDALVADGAKFVVVFPYFLLPGRHWAEDIPALAREAAAKHPQVGHLVAAPLGIHRLMAEIIQDRIQHCLRHVTGNAPSCDICDEAGNCSWSSRDS